MCVPKANTEIGLTWLFPCFCSCESKTCVCAQLCVSTLLWPALQPGNVAAASLTSWSAAPKNDAFDGNTFGRLPRRIHDGALPGWGAEPGVGVSTRLSCTGTREKGHDGRINFNLFIHFKESQGGARCGLGTIVWGPILVLPGGHCNSSWQGLINAFPVNSSITGFCHVGKDGVLEYGFNGIGVCFD